jgi:hypothetical protein
MSTLALRTAYSYKPETPPSVLARAVAFVATVFDAFDDAKRQANAAHQRYPFGRW